MNTAAVATLFGAVLAIALAYGSTLLAGEPPPWTPWILALAAPIAMIAAAVAAVTRSRSRFPPVLAAAFAVTLLLVIGGFVLALLLPGTGEPLLFGLPRRAALVLYGIGLLPLLVLPVAYALTFDAGSADSDAARIRELVAHAESNAGGVTHDADVAAASAPVTRSPT